MQNTERQLSQRGLWLQALKGKPDPQSSEPYTEDMLQERFHHFTKLQESNNVSPKTQKLAENYVLHAALALHYMDEAPARAIVFEELQKLDKQVVRNGMFHQIIPDKLRDVVAEMAELYEWKYFSRYGDYFEDQMNRRKGRTNGYLPKTEAETMTSVKYWSDFNNYLVEEEERRHFSTQYFTAFIMGCKAGGYDREQTRTLIRLRAGGNADWHKDLDKMVKEGNFGDLRRILWEDLQGLENTFGPDKAEDERAIRAAIECQIRRWFELSPGAPEDGFWDAWHSWVPTKQLVEDHRAAVKAQKRQRNED